VRSGSPELSGEETRLRITCRCVRIGRYDGDS